MFRIIVYGIVFFMVTPAFSQVYQQYVQGENSYRGIFKPMQYSLSYDEIQGSPYLNDELMKGLAVFRNGDSIYSYLRYNIYEDVIEYLEGEQLMSLSNPQQIDHILIGNSKFLYLSYKTETGLQKGYLIEEAVGKVNLYRKPVRKYLEPEDPITGYHKSRPATFNEEPSQWFIGERESIMETDISKSSLQKILGDSYDEVMAYQKKQKLKLKRDEDVVRLLEYYNAH